MDTIPPKMPTPNAAASQQPSSEMMQLTIMAIVSSDEEAIAIKKAVQDVVKYNKTAQLRFSITPQPTIPGR